MLHAQTIVSPADPRRESNIYANRVALEYMGLSLDDVRADDFRGRVFSIPTTSKEFAKRVKKVCLAQCRSRMSNVLWARTASTAGF